MRHYCQVIPGNKDDPEKDSSPQFKLMGGDSLTIRDSCVSNEDDDYQLQISFSSDKFFKKQETYINPGCKESC